MKTEIDRICGIMYTLLEHQPVIDVPYEKINDIAVALVKEGYGKISEYKAEIERLRTTLGQCNTELNSALESLKSQCREIGELRAKVKQAKIDVLNELKGKMFEREYMGVKYKERIFYESEIDDMIAEVQNGEDKS